MWCFVVFRGVSLQMHGRLSGGTIASDMMLDELVRTMGHIRVCMYTCLFVWLVDVVNAGSSDNDA